MPSTPFTEAEVETVREIIREPGSFTSNLSAMLSDFNDAQAAATRTDIAQWNRIKFGTVSVQPTLMKGTDYSIDRDRDLITARVRERLSMTPKVGNIGPNEFGAFSINIGNASSGDPYCDEFG